MKYLKKFNENVAEKYLQMHEILKDVFAELIDDTTIQVEFGYESDDSEILVTIKPWTKTQTAATEMTTEQMVERYSKYLELVKDIEVSYKRAVDELNTKGKLMVAVDNRIYMAFQIPGAQKTEYPF
jgi:methionine synthase II (cobalamin-independent)